MTRLDIESQIASLLRAAGHHGANWVTERNRPLGESGMDSLALINFLTSVENEFQVDLPDRLWEDRDALTQLAIVSFLTEHAKSDCAATADNNDTPKERISDRHTTFIRRTRRFVGRFLAKNTFRRIYKKNSSFILKLDMTSQKISPYEPAIPLTFREGARDDIPSVAELLGPDEFPADPKVYNTRLDRNCRVVVAEHGGQIVAADWLVTDGYREPYTGLNLKLANGACYGFDLRERREFKGQGIGMATLSYALAHALNQGYTNQYSIIHSENTLMLVTARQVFGFQTVGEVDTVHWFGRPHSRWSVNGRSGAGGEILFS